MQLAQCAQRLSLAFYGMTCPGPKSTAISRTMAAVIPLSSFPLALAAVQKLSCLETVRSTALYMTEPVSYTHLTLPTIYSV